MSHYLIRAGAPGVVLAPMEGVTDAPMRALLSEKGGYLFCVSEFLRVTDQVPPRSVFKRHVPELERSSQTENGTPVVVQLLGGNAERLAQSAQRAIELGAQGIDLNFGCPAPTVNKHDGGATLLKYPKRLFEIVSMVRNAVPREFSVSAKLRLGWENPDDIFENIDQVVSAGASWITLHARTRMQGYSKPVYWDHIRRVREMSTIPIVANGDIWNFESFLKCHEETGCEHFMLGRGAVSNPWLALDVTRFLGSSIDRSTTPGPTTPKEWRPLLERLSSLSTSHTPKPAYLVRRMKQWVRMASMERPIGWFEQLKKVQDLNEVWSLFESMSSH